MPPLEIRELDVPWSLYLKLAAKTPPISVEEVREAVANAKTLAKGPKNPPGVTKGRCYFVEAPTDAGRTLKVLLRRFSGGHGFVITAWDPNA